ncbi:hypothetical protein LINGRAHAP2_LOCUS15235 [Linum grandiflorum]
MNRRDQWFNEEETSAAEMEMEMDVIPMIGGGTRNEDEISTASKNWTSLLMKDDLRGGICPLRSSSSLRSWIHSPAGFEVSCMFWIFERRRTTYICTGARFREESYMIDGEIGRSHTVECLEDFGSTADQDSVDGAIRPAIFLPSLQ